MTTNRFKSLAPASDFVSLATRAQGPHPFPSRTRTLRPAAPMVLRPRGRGRVGRRRHLKEASHFTVWRLFFAFSRILRTAPCVVSSVRALNRSAVVDAVSPGYAIESLIVYSHELD